jgi:hypothetical protein
MRLLVKLLTRDCEFKGLNPPTTDAWGLYCKKTLLIPNVQTQ